MFSARLNSILCARQQKNFCFLPFSPQNNQKTKNIENICSFNKSSLNVVVVVAIIVVVVVAAAAVFVAHDALLINTLSSSF